MGGRRQEIRQTHVRKDRVAGLRRQKVGARREEVQVCADLHAQERQAAQNEGLHPASNVLRQGRHVQKNTRKVTASRDPKTARTGPKDRCRNSAEHGWHRNSGRVQVPGVAAHRHKVFARDERQQK